jgi:uncharacterized membrane protein YccC
MSLAKRLYEQQTEREAPAARLERARQSVRIALRAAGEEKPDTGMLCDIERALHAALREMEQLQIAMSGSERPRGR